MSDTVKAAAPSELTDEQIAEAMYRAFLDDPVAKVRSPEHVKDWRRVFDAAIAALSTESPQEATPAPSAEPVAWGLLKPDGTLEYDLVGTKADCEFWSRAERELQSGWPVVPLYLATPAVAPGVDVDLDAPVWKHEPPTLSAVIAELRRTLQPYFPDT